MLQDAKRDGSWDTTTFGQGEAGIASATCARVCHAGSMTTSLKIVVMGTGHVGLVSVATLASLGHHVVGFDVNTTTIQRLQAGDVHFHEPGLADLLADGVAAGRVRFTDDPAEAISGADVAMICVGTPTNTTDLDESLDLSYVQAAAKLVIAHADRPIVIVEKSTVPPGTGDRIEAMIALHRGSSEITVASNPEFLREGQAVADTLRPDRIVVGANDETTHKVLADLYAPQLEAHPCPYVKTDRATAEIIKQASNAFLAMKISFINEMAQLCEAVGADIATVADGMGHDPRIGRAFLNAGIGYGGSCFPKDVLGLEAVFQQHELHSHLVSAVRWANDRVMTWPVNTLQRALWNLKGATIAVLGATFKPHTDDIRESVALVAVQELLNAGATVRLTDPVALAHVAASITHDQLVLCDTVQEAVTGADAVFLATEWPEYVGLNPQDLVQWLATPVAVDGRIVWDVPAFTQAGLQVYQVGRRVGEGHHG